MPKPASKRVAPLFPSWLPHTASSFFTPEPVNYHQALLEMPKEDRFREEAIRGRAELEACDISRLPEVPLSIQALKHERLVSASQPRPGSPGAETLRAKFARWDDRKQSSLVDALAAFHTQSFAIERAHISEAAVRASTAAHLTPGQSQAR